MRTMSTWTLCHELPTSATSLENAKRYLKRETWLPSSASQAFHAQLNHDAFLGATAMQPYAIARGHFDAPPEARSAWARSLETVERALLSASQGCGWAIGTMVGVVRGLYAAARFALTPSPHSALQAWQKAMRTGAVLGAEQPRQQVARWANLNDNDVQRLKRVAQTLSTDGGVNRSNEAICPHALSGINFFRILAEDQKSKDKNIDNIEQLINLYKELPWHGELRHIHNHVACPIQDNELQAVLDMAPRQGSAMAILVDSARKSDYYDRPRVAAPWCQRMVAARTADESKLLLAGLRAPPQIRIQQETVQRADRLDMLPYEMRYRIFEVADIAALLARIGHTRHSVQYFDSAVLAVLHRKLQNDLPQWPPFLAANFPDDDALLFNFASTAKFLACIEKHRDHRRRNGLKGGFFQSYRIGFEQHCHIFQGKAVTLLGQMRAGDSQIFWSNVSNDSDYNRLAILSVNAKGAATCDVFQPDEGWLLGHNVTYNMATKLATMHQKMPLE